MNLVEVVIPIYKVDLSELELSVLKNNVEKLNKYSITIICPESLDVSSLTLINETRKLKVERFDNIFFRNIDGYNRLMYSAHFYRRFLDSEYILICQTDAFVFRDELSEWCKRKYDYIGAPWIASPDTLLNKFFKSVNDILYKLQGKKPRNVEHYYKVGNGGFSLRKVKSHLEIAERYENLIDEYIMNKEKSIYHVEDIFWSIKAPDLDKRFKIPDYKEAVSFAIDRKPSIAIKLNNGSLPFACHGFDKPKVSNFWKAIISKELEKYR